MTLNERDEVCISSQLNRSVDLLAFSLSLEREEVVFLWGHLAGNTGSDECRFEARGSLGVFPDAPKQFFPKLPLH